MVLRLPTDREATIVGTLLPSTSLDRAAVVRRGSHDVVLLPDVAAVRIARSAPAVESLPRRTGWPTIAKAVDAATYARARTWYGTFTLEQIVKYLLDDTDAAATTECVGRVVRWMDSDALG